MADKKAEDLEEHQLEDYIKKELKKGFSEEKIKNTLLKAGHSKEAVEGAFKAVKLKKIPINNKKLIILISCFIIIVIVVSFYIKKAPSQGIEESKEYNQKLMQVQAEFKDCLRKDIKWNRIYDCFAHLLVDEKLCGSLSPSLCSYAVLWKKTLSTRNISYCDMIIEITPADEKEAAKQLCEFTRAVVNENLSLCSTLDSKNKVKCRAVINDNIDQCDNVNLNESERINCKTSFFTIKSIKSGKDYCNGIKSVTNNIFPYDNCKSYMNTDPEKCIEIDKIVYPACYKRRDQRLRDLGIEVPHSILEELDQNIIKELVEETQIKQIKKEKFI